MTIWFKMLILALIAGVGAFFMYTFLQLQKKKETPVTQEQVVAMQKIVLINVLNKEQYVDCHIPGSISVPFQDLEQFAQTLDKNTEIILYCSNYQCTASSAGAQMLIEKGFSNVSAFEGGIAQWYQLGYPVEGTCALPYLKKEIAEPQKSDLASEGTLIKIITAQELKQKLDNSAA